MALSIFQPGMSRPFGMLISRDGHELARLFGGDAMMTDPRTTAALAARMRDSRASGGVRP
jgi:hypothetical protein